MMGQQDDQKDLFSYHVDLDKRVRSDNPLRQIQERIDFTFVRAEVEHFYGHNGNESVDPAVIMKMMFLLFLDDVASERELMKVIAERLDYMWFLGYGLNDEIPNHSVLSKARARWGVDVFETIFVRLVAQCQQAGLIEGKKIHMDGSLVEANASTGAVLEGSPELIEQLREQLAGEMDKLDERTSDYGSLLYERKNKRLLNTTDPDAPIVSRRKGGGGSRARYKTHRVVDDAKGVITASETTAGDVEENAKLMDLVDQHEANTGERVQTVVADRQYGTNENFGACHKRGIRSHMGDLRAPQMNIGHRKGIFPAEAYIYDAQTDSFMCPAGQTLSRRKRKTSGLIHYYSAPRGTCLQCSMRAQCTRAETQARVIQRYLDQDAIDVGRAQSHTPEAKRDRRRRKWLMEGSFADAANNHGFKRSRWRRLWRQQIQDYLIATVQNARILIRHTRCTPRLAAQALRAGGLVRLRALPCVISTFFSGMRLINRRYKLC